MGHYRSEMYDPSDDDPIELQKRAIRRMAYERWFYHAFMSRRVFEFYKLGWEKYKEKYGKKGKETEKD